MPFQLLYSLIELILVLTRVFVLDLWKEQVILRVRDLTTTFNYLLLSSTLLLKEDFEFGPSLCHDVE